MYQQILPTLKLLSQTLPLELFTFVGTLLEEVVAPIPAPLILVTAGGLAHTQQRHILSIFILSAVAAASKTLVSWFFFFIAGKAEDFLVRKFGHYLGLTHENIVKIGAYFNGTWKDEALIFLARAIPIAPTTTVSLAAGFIKINTRSFLQATFVGYYVRCIIFLYLGYTGASVSDTSPTQIIFASVLTLGLVLLYIFNPFVPKNKKD